MLERIKELRKNARLTQAEVAKRIGSNVSSYNLMENGFRKLPVAELMQLSKLYGVSADYILFGKEGDST